MTLDKYLLALALDATTEEIPNPETILVNETDCNIITQAIENLLIPN